MTVEDWLDENAGKVKIGTDRASGYFYIGTTADLLMNRVKYENQMLQHNRRIVKQAENAVEFMRNNPATVLSFADKYKEGTAQDYISYIGFWLDEYRRKQSTLQAKQERWENYIPLFSREVKQAREATAFDMDTTILIIDGYEGGAYWTADEVEEGNMKFGGVDVKTE